MKRIGVLVLLLASGVVAALGQSQSQTAAQQSQTAAQQSQTAAQQSQTAAQQSQTAQQQSQTAAQQSQIAQQQTQAARQAQPSQAATDQAYMAEVKSKQEDRLRASRDVMNMVLTGKFIGKGLVEKAKCVVVIPSLKRVGFVAGVDYGRGAMSCRLGQDFKGPFSAPSMIALEGGNFGLQIGVQVNDLVLLVMNDRGVNSLLGSKSKLGVDASVAAGPFGRSAMAATDMGMKADILAFSRTGGVYLGAVLNGSSLRPDGTGNHALYGRELTSKQIVRSGEVPVPPAGKPLINLLDQTRVASAAPAGGENK